MCFLIVFFPALSFFVAYALDSVVIMLFCNFCLFSNWHKNTMIRSKKAEIFYCNIIPMPTTDPKKFMLLCKQAFRNHALPLFFPQFFLYASMIFMFSKFHFAVLFCIVIINVWTIIFHVFAVEWARRNILFLQLYLSFEGFAYIMNLLAILKIGEMLDIAPFSGISVWAILVMLLLLSPILFFVVRFLFIRLVRSCPFENETAKLKQQTKTSVL